MNPNRFQFEPPESIAEESPGSIQQSAKLDVRILRRPQSNITIDSQQQQLVDPEQFSSQNPWSTQLDGSNETGQIEKLQKSVSASPVGPVKRFWKKDHSQLPGDSNRVKFLDHDPSQEPSHRQGLMEPRDFSSSFTPTEIVILPQRRNPRIGIVMKPESPLSIGGGILHGRVEITIDPKQDLIPGPPLGIGYLSVDLVGVESCNKKYHIFQSLAIDLIDRNRSPPSISTPSISASHDGFWELQPSTFSLPFQLQLPEDPGPPPYRSRHGSIRYILSTTAVIRIGPEETFVRDTCEIFILSPHNRRFQFRSCVCIMLKLSSSSQSRQSTRTTNCNGYIRLVKRPTFPRCHFKSKSESRCLGGRNVYIR